MIGRQHQCLSHRRPEKLRSTYPMVEVAREDERREEDLRVLDIERGAGAVSSRLGSTSYIPHPHPHSTHPESAYVR